MSLVHLNVIVVCTVVCTVVFLVLQIQLCAQTMLHGQHWY